MNYAGKLKTLFVQEKSTYNYELIFIIKHMLKKLLPSRLYITMQYKKKFGVFPRLREPRTFNEKICCRRFRPEAIFSELSDKVEVRNYVEKKVGEKYLIPIYGVCNSLTEEVYESLPESFVMKANHGSRYNLIVDQKSQYSFDDLKYISDRWLSANYYAIAREAHYKKIKPKILFEEKLILKNRHLPLDFKFFCFRKSGAAPVVIIEVSYDRFTNYKVDYYNQNWEKLDVVEERFVKGADLPRPDNLDEAMEVALKLSEEFSFVRVDLYMVDGKIYFGELTFTPTAGVIRFKTRKVDEEWGQLFDS
ncbi:ATP-grasp fold amidoligase family protein [Modicisalibacter luteus]|uniref:ATP-grasp fold amidoligase family protein n=1 Tax=Modicisalibacter luteus TaxID=453962 RepID=A0ABV7LXX3_9GAMM|nr:ATP-grasp fold amidoligase family protein [Halomonas lutea]GHB05525.1 glycosyl transferase [Halomonas lutea]